MTTNAETVRAATSALVRADALALMGYLTPDVRWSVGGSGVGTAPWFGRYRGKRGVLQLLDAMVAIGPAEVTEKALLSEGDLVVTWVNVVFTGPNGRAVDADEAHFWRLVGGRIASVDFLVDTAAVSAAFE